MGACFSPFPPVHGCMAEVRKCACAHGCTDVPKYLHRGARGWQENMKRGVTNSVAECFDKPLINGNFACIMVYYTRTHR